MSLPSVVVVCYPKGTKFDMDYYLGTHMPLVQSSWAKYGLKRYKVVKYQNADTEESETPWLVQCWLEWEGAADASATAFQGPETKDVMADVPKFSDKQPIIMSGEMTGSVSF